MRRRHRSAESTPSFTGGSASPLRLSRSAEGYSEYLRSELWRGKRILALARDGWKCAHPECGSTIGLEVHHKRYPKQWGTEPLSWLVTLCRGHHKFVHRLAKENNWSIAHATFVFMQSRSTGEVIDGQFYRVIRLPDGTRPRPKTWGGSKRKFKSKNARYLSRRKRKKG